MPDYAVHDGVTVLNVITAVDESAARDAVAADSELALIIDGFPGIGWTLHEDGWREPQPYPSWVWDDAQQSWQAPTSMPTEESNAQGEPIIWAWDESGLEWVAIVVPVGPTPEPE